jgi:hypothetical protein
MPFEWLKHHYVINKAPDYAAKTLAAYALGIRSGGSIRGVRIEVEPDGCQASKNLPHNAVYLPEDAPLIPLQGCTRGTGCTCVYRPVMAYQSEQEAGEAERE